MNISLVRSIVLWWRVWHAQSYLPVKASMPMMERKMSIDPVDILCFTPFMLLLKYHRSTTAPGRWNTRCGHTTAWC